MKKLPNICPFLTHQASLFLLSTAARLRLSLASLGVSRPVAKLVISLSSSTAPKTSEIRSNPNPLVSGIHFPKTKTEHKVNPPYKKYGPQAALAKKYGAVKATKKFVVQFTHCCTAHALARYRLGIISAV
jgi:hypothetical protein